MKPYQLVDYDMSSISDESDTNVNDKTRCVIEKQGLDGRIRQFSHLPGNWACSIFIKIKLNDLQNNLIDSLYRFLLENLVDIVAIEKHELHISLSRTVPIRYHYISTIEKYLYNMVEKINAFSIEFHQNLNLLTNDNQSRTFVVLNVSRGSNILSFISELIDELLDKFDLPPYYQDPQFHCSIFWTTGNRCNELNNKLNNLNNQIIPKIVKQISTLFIDRLYLKIGKKTKKFYFSIK